MLDKKLEDIKESDLDELVANAVTESKTIEFKKELPGAADSDKREFLADVSSFANATGGDLIYGIEAIKGVAKNIIGLESVGIDDAILKWEGVLRTGLEPRMRFEIHRVALANGRTVLIIRILKSWTGPHRVTFRAHDEFYTRGAAGKFIMNVADLRTAFNLTDSILERIGKFRTERISEIANRHTPVPLSSPGCVIVHLVPIEAFEPGAAIDLEPLVKNRGTMKPMYCNGWDHRYTYEGYFAYQGGDKEKTRAFVHVYRNGIIEAVVSDVIDIDAGRALLFDWMYEKEIPTSTQEYLNLQKQLGVRCPVYVFLTFVGVKGCRLRSAESDSFIDPQFALDKDIIDLPGTVIEDWENVDTIAIFRPMFDLIWNACGYPRSINFDENGAWRSR